MLVYSEKILSLTNEIKIVVQSKTEPAGKLEIGSVETVINLVQCHYSPEKYSKINTVFTRRKDAYLTSTLEKFIETFEHSEGEPAYLLT
ncbi:hypothetical protein [Sporosarcina sp. FSL K6-2383]|uniref:hypothetical protein n=1 Tax=Sporosarcina sp. FSL K6-2383 TaxID=2921556 RepID=UPI00315B01ED